MTVSGQAAKTKGGVRADTLPHDALLQKYAATAGDYTDCFSAIVDGDVTHDQFVAAFYTTWLFRLERLVLRFAVSRPSTDQDVADMLAGENHFAAWRVEARSPDQLLMCDMADATRSWFMVQKAGAQTILYFGSAVVAGHNGHLGMGFKILMPLHRLYARALLACAVTRMRRMRG